MEKNTRMFLMRGQDLILVNRISNRFRTDSLKTFHENRILINLILPHLPTGVRLLHIYGASHRAHGHWWGEIAYQLANRTHLFVPRHFIAFRWAQLLPHLINTILIRAIWPFSGDFRLLCAPRSLAVAAQSLPQSHLGFHLRLHTARTPRHLCGADLPAGQLLRWGMRHVAGNSVPLLW